MRYSAAQSTGKQLLFILYHSRPLAFISGLASITAQRSALRESRRLARTEVVAAVARHAMSTDKENRE